MPARKFTPEAAKDIAIISCVRSIDADARLKKLADVQLPEAFKHKKTKSTKEINESFESISLAYSLESGHALVESLMPRYRGFALKLKKDLEKEFDCKTASEVALVDQAVSAHIRKISNAKLIEERNEPEWLSHEKIALLNFYSREVDRAHRQFISAIETLKIMKQPVLKVNVKTNNAFIGENQQFNNNVENNNSPL